MNRRHTRADYLDVIARLKDARPDMAFSSDFIVGSPGETEADFAATLSIVGEVGYAGAFSFKYSPRPGTPAAERDDQVDDAAKVERLARLQAEIDRHQAAFNQRCVGRTLDVLLEKPGRLPGQLVGRSPYLQPVQAMAPAALIGEVVPVTITRAGANSLFGELARPPARDAAAPELASLES
jgi:tRNA-2-methylthio-N6-dimethylallyladenosine synthase